MDSTQVEAWCPRHSVIESIMRVHSTHTVRGVADGTQALVALECGERLSIITSSKNLKAMRML